MHYRKLTGLIIVGSLLAVAACDDGSTANSGESLLVGSPRLLSANSGFANYISLKAARSEGSILMAAAAKDTLTGERLGTIVTQRFTLQGAALDPAPNVLQTSRGRPLSVVAAPGGGWVVTWLVSGTSLGHSFIRSDGTEEATVVHTLPVAPDALITCKATPEGVWVWTARCEPLYESPVRTCDIVRHHALRNGTIEDAQVLVGDLRVDLPVVGTVTATQGAIAWVRRTESGPKTVEAIFTDGEGTALSAVINVGAYSPTEHFDGFVGAPKAIAIRDDTAVVTTRTELLYVDSSGLRLEQESRDELRFKRPQAIAPTRDGYLAVMQGESLWMEQFLEDGSQPDRCWLAANGNPQLLSDGDDVWAIWIEEEGDPQLPVQRVRVGNALTCEVGPESIELPASYFSRGHSGITAWGSSGGLAALKRGRLRESDPAETLVTALGADGSPVGEAWPTPGGVSRILPTSDGFWMETSSGVIAVAGDGSAIGRHDHHGLLAWADDYGWALQPNDFLGYGTSTTSYQLNRLDAELNEVAEPRAVVLLGIATQLVPSDDGLLLIAIGRAEGSFLSIIDPLTRQTRASMEVRGFGTVVSCGPSCWISFPGPVRIELSADSVVKKTMLPNVTPGFPTRAGDYLLINAPAQGKLSLYDRKGESLLAETTAPIDSASLSHVSMVSGTRFALTYTGTEPDLIRGPGTFIRFIDVVR